MSDLEVLKGIHQFLPVVGHRAHHAIIFGAHLMLIPGAQRFTVEPLHGLNRAPSPHAEDALRLVVELEEEARPFRAEAVEVLRDRMEALDVFFRRRLGVKDAQRCGRAVGVIEAKHGGERAVASLGRKQFLALDHLPSALDG